MLHNWFENILPLSNFAKKRPEWTKNGRYTEKGFIVEYSMGRILLEGGRNEYKETRQLL